MPCAPCSQRGLKALFARKLGTCSSCIRWARLGTYASWVLVALLILVGASVPLVGGAILLAAAFTLLLALHAIAFAVDEAPRVVRHEHGARLFDRRHFVWSGLKLGLGVVVLAAVGRWPRPALAQQPPRDCHCEIPDGAFSLGDPKNNQWTICVDTEKVGCFGDCPGEQPPPCLDLIECKWDEKKTKVTKGKGKFKFPGKQDFQCCVTLLAQDCPVEAHLEVEVTVKCFCGNQPVAGAAGTCTKVISTDIKLNCCCPDKIESKIKRGDSGATPGGLRQVQWTAAAVTVKCLKDCEFGAALVDCDRKNTKCTWSVTSKEAEGDPNLAITGGNQNCEQVTVVSSPRAKYEVCRTVSFTCECGLQATTCEYKECHNGP